MILNFIIPKKLRPRRVDYFICLLLCIFGIVISISLFYNIQRNQQLLFKTEFERRTLIYQTALQRGLDRNVTLIKSLAGLYATRKHVGRDEFHIFTRWSLARYPEIQALEWIPRVTAEQRELYEKQAHESGLTNFKITERKEQGEMVTATLRDEYFPVYYVEPLAGNETAVGFDLASNTVRLQTLQKSRDSGEMLATKRITLVQEESNQAGFLIFHPLFNPKLPINTPREKHQALIGYVLGVFRIGHLVETALLNVGFQDLDILIQESSFPQQRQTLYQQTALMKQLDRQKTKDSLQTELQWQGRLNLPGHYWSLQLQPNPYFSMSYSSLQSWQTLITGLLITLLLTIYLLHRLYNLVSAETLIKAKNKAEEKLHLADSVLKNTSESVMITDTNLLIISINPAFTKTTGYKEEEAIGQKTSLLKSGYHDKAFYGQMWQTLQETEQWQGEIWNRRKDGQIYPEWLSITTIRNKVGKISHYAAIFSDLSSQQHIRKHLQQLAYYDVLTGLPNRKLFQDRFDFCLNQAEEEHKMVALLFLDLDKFKKINDTLGHSVGDELLNLVAKRLKVCLRDIDIIARLGGDEFTIIIPDVISSEDIHKLSQRLIHSFNAHFLLQDRKIFVTLSIGISIYPMDGNTQEVLTKHADTAMYQAKEKNGSSYLFYKKEMNANFLVYLELEDQLYRAIQQQELKIAYQPQIDLTTGRLCGAEALLRWHHPIKGWISPEIFIPIAEESGLIQELGAWVLEKACLQTKQWIDEGYSDFIIAVNLSGEQVSNGKPIEMLQQVLKRTKLSPSNLELELTETALVNDIEFSMQILSKLKKMNIHLAIDDFGTGYSSLNYLKQFPIDKLKIDKSFVDHVICNDKDASIANSIIVLGHNLNLKVIAEGVETQKQLEFLKAQGCDQIQGYFYSRPLFSDDMSTYLNKNYKKCSD